MRALHHQAIKLHLSLNENLSALKKALRVYFLIEPCMSPPELPELRLNTLYIIVSFLSPGTSTFAGNAPPEDVFMAVTDHSFIFARSWRGNIRGFWGLILRSRSLRRLVLLR